MEFTVDGKTILRALDDIQGKGKYGISNNNLNNCVYMELVDNTLDLWNADATLCLNITLEVQGIEDGTFVFDAKSLLPFLRKFKEEVSFRADQVLEVGQGGSVVTLPRVVAHSDINAITRIKGMLKDIAFEEEIETLWMFATNRFEGAFSLDSEIFKKTMGLCELIPSGVYRLDYAVEDSPSLVISTQTSATNRYIEAVSIENPIGESATVEWTGPLHKFFDGRINVYVKDNFPLLLIGEDRKLIRAPHMSS